MLVLRELERADLGEINRWRARRDMIRWLGAPYRFINPEVDEAWFDAYMADRAHTVRCAIIDDDAPSEILALATLSSIDWVSGTCTFHVMVGPDHQGRGIGKFALSGMLEHAFLDLGLRRVELGVLATNERALTLYERAGFVCEGTKRSAVFKHGAYVDMHIMGLLREEWNPTLLAIGAGGG